MTFVNEYIPEEDFQKYDLASIDAKFVVGGVKARDWTIDRERGIFLRIVARGREEFGHLSTWILFWKGDLIEFELENVSTSAPVGGAAHGHKRIRKLAIPSHLEAQRQPIQDCIEEALTAYRTGGVFSTATSYSLRLEF